MKVYMMLTYIFTADIIIFGPVFLFEGGELT